jgi:iron complex outermembrane receptor protein
MPRKEAKASFNRYLSMTAAVGLALPIATEAQPTSGADAKPAFEEVVVTARRRAESIADVPAQIASLDAGALVKQGIRTEADLQYAVPGLMIRSALANNQYNFVIRGQSADAYSGSQPGVQPYINEIPVSANTSTMLYDLAQVQVLKGPQGTLFGRNSTGGAVLFTTAEPEPELSGYAQVEYGRFDRLETQGALNLPLADDVALLRLAAAYNRGGGFFANLYDRADELGDQNAKSGRATLLLQPGDRISNKTVVEISRFDGDNQPMIPYSSPCRGVPDCSPFEPSVPAFVSLISGTGGVFPAYPRGNVYQGGFASFQDALEAYSDYTGWVNAPLTFEAETDYAMNTTTFELSPSLSLKNILGYTETYYGRSADNDATPYPLLQPGSDAHAELEQRWNRTWTNELQLQGQILDDRLSFILGAFYLHYTDTNNSPVTGAFIIPPDVVGAFNVRYHNVGINESTALFAQATYAVTDVLNLTVGGRYTWVDISLEQKSDSSLEVGIGRQETTEEDPSYTFTVDYRLTPDLMLYATTRRSWRNGGFNPFVAPVAGTVTAEFGGNYFAPETVEDVEVGAKYSGEIAGVPMQGDFSVYRAWVTDVQKTAYVLIGGAATSATVSVDEAQINGAEGSLSVLPTPWLQLGIAVSYSDAEFTENLGFINGVANEFGPVGDVPRWSGNAYAEFDLPLSPNWGRLSYRIDYFAQSEFYFSNLNDTLIPGTKIDSYHLLNMRLDWEQMFGSAVTGSLFVKNVTDEYYFTGGNPTAPINGTNSVNTGEPRVWGLGVRAEF